MGYLRSAHHWDVRDLLLLGCSWLGTAEEVAEELTNLGFLLLLCWLGHRLILLVHLRGSKSHLRGRLHGGGKRLHRDLLLLHLRGRHAEAHRID